jgi:hypothetical protein
MLAEASVIGATFIVGVLTFFLLMYVSTDSKYKSVRVAVAIIGALIVSLVAFFSIASVASEIAFCYDTYSSATVRGRLLPP